ncbi:MAG: type III-B CRISPR-associated protein Cas10/Cmr2 [Bryobacteraceae bacterium]|nr:type III-B CRISPR-associated protein Cas10/Cmr2 [Bryobacteraceae bacterium]
MNLWQRKLLAFLHDPPEKGYDYGPRHKERAEQYKNRILGGGSWQGHEPDWEAAAADRFIFPDGKKLNELGLPGLSGGVQFSHPLSGISVLRNFPASEVAGDLLSGVFPEFGATDELTQFWLLWRCWLHFAVTHTAGQREGAETLAYLPADTRMLDGTIWHHNAVVSALEATRGEDGKLHPVFLLFQVGPVQDFISQARSTRDLWSGSYLLSWMMGHALQVVADQYGPDNVIYPSLRGQPLYDWLNQARLKSATYGGDQPVAFWDSLGLAHSQDVVLTPNLPNRFLAIVPAGFDVSLITTAFDRAWEEIAEKCWEYLDSRCPLGPDKRQMWTFQIQNFWQVTWQLWPWQNLKEALGSVSKLAIPAGSQLKQAKAVAEAIPAEHQDSRNYPLRDGWGWSAHYQLASHRHEARRQTRNFAEWQGRDGTPKDQLSGKEEVISDKAWLAMARLDGELKHLFRKEDELGAVNVIKRVWHRAYLDEEHNLKRARISFDSVPAVAVAPWVESVRARLVEPALWEDFSALTEKLAACAPLLDVTIPDARANEHRWLDRVNAEVFHAGFWHKLDADIAMRPEIQAAAKALANLKAKHQLGEPSGYYAVIALDGDGIGQWLSGEKTPRVEQVIAGKAAEYFRQHVPGADPWLKSRRPLSPSYHLQFSEALANFGLYCAQRIVEAHQGQLIYAGGDDVLAMLPASEAIACAEGLRLAFRGSPQLPDRYTTRFAEAPEGFIKLRDGDWNQGARRQAEPSWPLLVPGIEADLSAGIAIGHIHAPLQNLVEAARTAEGRAKKDYGKSAFAISLFKRSGETIEWGAKWESRAIALAEQFTKLTEDDRLSAKFPYALARLLRAYAIGKDFKIESKNGFHCVKQQGTEQKNGFDPFKVFPAEFAHCVKQQGTDVPDAFAGLAKDYLHDCEGRRLDDFLGPFLTTVFIHRGGDA